MSFVVDCFVVANVDVVFVVDNFGVGFVVVVVVDFVVRTVVVVADPKNREAGTFCV